MPRSRLLPLLIVPALVAALAGCGVGPGDDESGTGGLGIVASTDVYGSLAGQLGGDAVSVTSVIDSAAQDPHSYEASARDRLAIAEADVVIVNGGGYDAFMDSLLDASGTDSLVVLDASELSGLEPDAGGAAHTDSEAEHHDHEHVEGFNEHVWYDLHAMQHVAEAITETLIELDPEHETAFTSNLQAFLAGLEVVHGVAAEVAEAAAGRDVALTEPVPAYLLAEVGLVNVTPPGFTEAIEEGDDVAPRDLQALLALLDGGTIALLAYNDQTTNAQTEQVREAAEHAGIPVVSFAETLPDGLDYLGWMTQNLEHIAVALT